VAWKPLLALQAIAALVALALQAPPLAYATLRMPPLIATPVDPNRPPDVSWLLGLAGYVLLAVAGSVLVAAVVTVASMHVGTSAAIGVPPRVGPALGIAVRRMFPMVGWQVLAGLIMLVALLACILPVFYAYAVFTILPAVVAFERGNAIGRCFRFFHNDLGSAAARTATIRGIGLAAGVAASLVGNVLSAVAQVAFAGSAGLVAGVVASTAVAVMVGGGVAVLLMPMTLTAYADLRARVEPLTTATLAQEIGLQPLPADPLAQRW
jgi:hypothetical protein